MSLNHWNFIKNCGNKKKWLSFFTVSFFSFNTVHIKLYIYIYIYEGERESDLPPPPKKNPLEWKCDLTISKGEMKKDQVRYC